MEENIFKYGAYDLDKRLFLQNIQSGKIKSSYINHYKLNEQQIKDFNSALGVVIDGINNGTLNPGHGLGKFADSSGNILDTEAYNQALEYIHRVADAIITNQPKKANKRSSVQEEVEQPVQPVQKEEKKEDVVTPELTPYTNNAHSFSAYFKQQTNPFGSYQLGSPEEEAHINEWAKQFNGDKLKMAQGLAKMIEDYGKQFDYTKVNLGNISQEDHQSGINNAVNALNDGYKPEEISALTYLNAGNYAKLFADDQTPTPPTPPQDINSEGFWDSLSDDDKIRIGTAGADVASALAAWIPGYGTAASGVLGVGSTLTNAYLDFFKDDKTSFWQDLGNLGFGLGMDIFGMIPGFGTGAKGAKVMKIVKPISGLLFTGFGYLGLKQAQDVLKRMEDPNYELTTDDIRALSAGISTLVGGSTYLANKKQMNRVTTARDVAEVRTKSGKPAKITQEELAEIQKLDGFEAQNAKFKNITGEELAAELKGRNLNPFSDDFQLTKNGPNVSTYKERNFVDEVPRKYRVLQVLNGETPKKTTTSTSETKAKTAQEKAEVEQMKKDAHKVAQAANEDNRIKQLRDISNRSKDLTQKQIDAINLDRGRRGLEPLTEKEISRINSRRKPTEDPDELREKSRKKKLEQIRQNKKNSPEAVKKDIDAAKAEYAEAVRQSLLAKPQGGTPIEAAPKGSGRTVAQIKKLAESIPTVKPKPEAKPVKITNLPAVIQKPVLKSLQEIAGPNGSPLKTMQGLDQALAQRMHSQGLEAKMNRMIEPHAEEVLGRKRKEYLSGLVRNVQNSQVPELPRKPLVGAARTAKEKMYDQLFNERYYAMQEALRTNKVLPHKNKEKAPKKKKQKDKYVNRRALGGILFAKGGNTINGTPILNVGNWYKYIGSLFRNDLLEGINSGKYTYSDINAMQDRHQEIDSALGANVTNPTENVIVKQYYTDIRDNYGYVNNKGIKSGEDSSRYKVLANPRTGDTLEGNWNPDGYYSGRGQDRKLLGVVGDYSEQELADTLKFWKDAGYEMYADSNNYYKLKPIETLNSVGGSDKATESQKVTDPNNSRKVRLIDISGRLKNLKPEESDSKGTPLEPLKTSKEPMVNFEDITSTFNYLNHIWTNKKLEDLSHTIPVLQYNLMNNHYFQEGDYNSLMEGKRYEGSINSAMQKQQTSNIDEFKSGAMEGWRESLKARDMYAQKDDARKAQTRDMSWQVTNQVKNYNLAAADKNAANIHQATVEQIGSTGLGMRANLDSTTNWLNNLTVNWWKRKQKQDEKNEKDEAIYQTLFAQDYNQNPGNYIQGWNENHTNLWNRFKAGEQFTDASEIKQLAQLKDVIQRNYLSRIYPNSKYLQNVPKAPLFDSVTTEWDPLSLIIWKKKGGKLSKNMVNAIINYLKESNKNYHKDADRSVKGLYNFIKQQQKK